MISDASIAQAITELESLRDKRDDHWQVPLVEGQLLHHIALSMHAKLIVEIGTSYGFSGLFWGAALKQTGGHLHTVDRDPRKVESSKQTFAKAGLQACITNHLGDARQIIATLPDSIDIAFIDADKPSTQAYFDGLWPKIRRGGCVLTDNVTSHRDELKAFVEHVRSRGDARSIEVAVGNGLEWTVKL